MPDEFDDDDDMLLELDGETALAPIQPEPEPEYSAGFIQTMIDYERRPEVSSWHLCNCGRNGARGRQCWQCWDDELRKL